jgi:hypothetical protein
MSAEGTTGWPAGWAAGWASATGAGAEAAAMLFVRASIWVGVIVGLMVTVLAMLAVVLSASDRSERGVCGASGSWCWQRTKSKWKWDSANKAKRLRPCLRSSASSREVWGLRRALRCTAAISRNFGRVLGMLTFNVNMTFGARELSPLLCHRPPDLQTNTTAMQEQQHPPRTGRGWHLRHAPAPAEHDDVSHIGGGKT